MISKEQFVKHVNAIKDKHDLDSRLNKFFSDNSIDGYIMFPDLTPNLIEVLHTIFGEADKEEWIEYFMFELNFGKGWKPGMVNVHGKDIPLSTPEELYDFLVSDMS